MSIINFKQPCRRRVRETRILTMVLLAAIVAQPGLGKNRLPHANDLFGYDRNAPFDVKEISATESNGVMVKDIEYAGYNSRHPRIKAYLVKPQGAGPFAGVLFFHWLGNAKSDRTQFLEEAKSLARQGVVSLLIQGFFPWLDQPTKAQADRQQVIDQTIEVRRGLDLLLSQPGVDPKRIGYVGHDYGAMFGSIASGVDKRVKSYVLIAGMGNFGDWSLKYWPVTAAEGAETYRRIMKEVDPIQYISRAAPANVLFQFANNDKFISKAVAQEFFDAAKQPKRALWYDTTHEMVIDAALNDRREWLTQQLSLSRPTAGSKTSSRGL